MWLLSTFRCRSGFESLVFVELDPDQRVDADPDLDLHFDADLDQDLHVDADINPDLFLTTTKFRIWYILKPIWIQITHLDRTYSSTCTARQKKNESVPAKHFPNNTV
jgi:hypothetical protein